MVANWELMAPSWESKDAFISLRKVKNSGWMGAVVEAAAAAKRVDSAASAAAAAIGLVVVRLGLGGDEGWVASTSMALELAVVVAKGRQAGMVVCFRGLGCGLLFLDVSLMGEVSFWG